MTIKLVATDMDGTFLDDDKNFDQKRFQKLYQYMQAHGIVFVCASGNQFDQLRSFFPKSDYPEALFVAENGALIADHNEIFRADTFEPAVAQKILNIIENMANVKLVLCGTKSAYIRNDVPEDFYELTKLYCPTLKVINNFQDVNDDFLKFSVNCPNDKTELYMEKLAEAIGSDVSIVSSGHGDIDIIRDDVSKANGLNYLSKKFDIKPSEMCAFGDGGNDLSMLEYVGHGVAMENGTDIVRQTADFQTSNNNEQGVLKHLEEIFEL